MIYATNYDDWKTTDARDYMEDDRPVCDCCDEHVSEGMYVGDEFYCRECAEKKFLKWTDGKEIRCCVCGEVIGTVDEDAPYYEAFGDAYCEDCFFEDMHEYESEGMYTWISVA